MTLTRSSKLTKLLDFHHISSKLAPAGFPRLMNLDAHTLLQNNQHETHMSYQEDTQELTVRHRLPSFPTNPPSTFPLASFLAVFDDVTTWALVMEDRLTRPGVSTHLSVERVGGAWTHGEVNVIARVTKVGNAFGYANVRAECVDTGQVICSGRHTKFFVKNGWLRDVALRPQVMPWTKWVAEKMEEKKLGWSVEDVEWALERTDNGKHGKFVVGKEHCNPYGTCHGGCQAILMESMANGYRATLNSNLTQVLRNPSIDPSSQLQSISVTYMSPAVRNLHFQCGVLHESQDSSSIRVGAYRDMEGTRPISEGVFRFVHGLNC